MGTGSDHILYEITTLQKIERLLRSYNCDLHQNVDTDTAEYKISIDTIKERNVLIKSADIRLVTKNNRVLATFRFAFYFSILDLEKYITIIGDSDFLVRDDLNLWLDDVVIATSRGIIYVDLQGSPLHEVIVPLTTPESLLKESQTIKN
jgi:hypothetical protein